MNDLCKDRKDCFAHYDESCVAQPTCFKPEDNEVQESKELGICDDCLHYESEEQCTECDYKQATNLGHYHEIIDRGHIICSMIDDFLIDHPGMTKEMDGFCGEAQGLIYKTMNYACSEERKFEEKNGS